MGDLVIEAFKKIKHVQKNTTHESELEQRNGNESRRMNLRLRDGSTMSVPVREALPITADRVRYPGFKQETTLLPKGSIRMKGYMKLPCDILLERDVPIQLEDGTTIYLDVFRPNDDEQHPALLACSPYGKEIGGQWLDDIPMRSFVKKRQTSGLHKFEGPDPAYWVNHGYVVVNPDFRGAYESEGTILYFGDQYGRDGRDIVEWMARRPWSNGKVGMTGNSWLAISQWFVAAQKPEHLSAIAPWEGLNNAGLEVATRGGVPTPEFIKTLSDTFASTAEGGIEDCISVMREHPVWDAYWDDKEVPLEEITAPAYIVASYTNFIHTYGTFEAWRRISSKDKWLRVHNTNEWQDYYTSENVEDLRKFFDYYLKGEDNGWEETVPVRLSVLNPGGRDVVNRPEKEFPLARTQYKKLYLDCKNKQLCDQLPVEKSSIVYDSDSKRNCVSFRYRMKEDSEICGYMKLRVYVTSLDADDMDLEVRLRKLSTLGMRFPTLNPASEPTAKGMIRVSLRALDPSRSTEENPRQSMAKVEKIEPGQVVPVDILIWPMGLEFSKGNILEVTVGAYKSPEPNNGPFGAMFGRAKMRIPKDRFTFMPGEKVDMVTVGGNAEETTSDSARIELPTDCNRGNHVLYSGGNCESYLYLPVIPNEKR